MAIPSLNPWKWFTAIISSVFTIAVWLNLTKGKRPPGPWGLPIIGHILSIDRKFSYKTFYRWSQKYGPIFRFRMGSVPVVVLADFQTIQKGFKQPSLNARPPLFVTNGIMNGYGVVSSDGGRWREQRTFTINCLRDFGFERSILELPPIEAKIITQTNWLVEQIKAKQGDAFDIESILSHAVGNIASSILFGTTFEFDQELPRQQELITKGQELVEVAGLLNSFPILRFIPWLGRGYHTLVKYKNEHHEFLTGIMNLHDQFYNGDADNPRDFIEAYEKRMIAQNARVGVEHHFTREQLRHVLGELFGASNENLTITVRWALLFLMGNPRVQTRLQEELDRVIGRERDPVGGDMEKLHYTRAVVLETQRLGNIAPLGAPHGASRDVSIDNYLIPKGTMVIALLWAANMDPNMFENPTEFLPERFIVDDVFRKPEHVVPFSVGMRVCVGETLAALTLQLIISRIAHRFRIERPTEATVIDYDPRPAFTLAPKDFDVRLIPRDN